MKINGQEIDSVEVLGARVHNLKNIDVEIPHYRLTVITGLSGSGKSSLAFVSMGPITASIWMNPDSYMREAGLTRSPGWM